MAEGRQPILRGTGQSDADMKGFNILNVGAVGDIQQATLIVEPGLAVAGEVGERGSGLPFSSIEAAVAVALAGDVIFLRPGIHAFDGTIDLFHLTGLKIIGYGAVITSLSEVNEGAKFTVRSSDVTIEGIEFDGGYTLPSVSTDEGCIMVSETGFTLKNCFIHDQNGTGVLLLINYDGVRILDCQIQTCSGGIFGESDVDTTVDTDGVWVKRCKIVHNRTFAVALTGPGPDNGKFITGIQITDNEFSTNDTENSASPAIALTFSCQGVQISGNHLENESSGIYLDKVRDALVEGNYLKAINTNAIWLVGCIGVNINDNLIDGRNSAGSPATNAPILISGQYAAPNDAGQFVITGNSLIFLKTASVAISISNATGITLGCNRIEGTILLAGVIAAVVNGNVFEIPQTTQAILIDTSNRSCSRITISSNRFRFTGASISRVIATVDALAGTIDDILIQGNATPTGVTYGQGTYVHSGSNVATRVVQIGNVPESATVTTGWVNSGAPVTQVLVSQARGVDSTGARQSRTAKFKTINAAITAATSGDTVVVEDGTFNERISAKDGITVRFMPSATLRCTSAGGCIVSSAVDQVFTVYHEHTPMVCTQNTSTAVSWTHSGAVLSLHASIEQTGAGTLPTALGMADGTVEIWGHILSANSVGVSMATNTPTLICHGGVDENPVIRGGSTALSALKGVIKVTNGTIQGPVVLNLTAMSFVVFKRVTFSNSGSDPAITITVVGSTQPILRDCVIVSGTSATQSIVAGSAQTIKLYGQTVANKGSDPPTNVTFVGGGTYDVSSSVTAD